MTQSNLSHIKDIFIRFAERECKGISPLYYFLSQHVARDQELLAIAAQCRERQPIPNLFFAAVHFLLMKNKGSKLATYYPSITRLYKRDLPFPLFKYFCLQMEDKIVEIQQSKIVQTNALNRCAHLMPIFSSLLGNKKINLIDIGSSAGLTLNFDEYEYEYNHEHLIGSSDVKIRSIVKEGSIPIFDYFPTINRKIGIDQNPLNLKDKDTALWLKSLIWADQRERFRKMEHAIQLAKQSDIKLTKGDNLVDFKTIIDQQETDIPLVVFHTHVLYQFKKHEREGFRALMDDIGSKRDLYYLAVEGSSVFANDYDSKAVLVVLTHYKNGQKTSKLVAETNGHANWIKWK